MSCESEGRKVSRTYSAHRGLPKSRLTSGADEKRRAQAEAGSVISHCGDCIGKSVTKDWLCKHRGIGDLLVDELDGIGVTVSRYKNYRHLANNSKPSSNFDAFAASFETNIDEGNIGLIVHSK